MTDQLKGIQALIKQQLDCAKKDLTKVNPENHEEVLKKIQLVKDHFAVIEEQINYYNERKAA